jgi:hypothetical protein
MRPHHHVPLAQPRHSAHWQLSRRSSRPKRDTWPSSHSMVSPCSRSTSMSAGSITSVAPGRSIARGLPSPRH